LPVFFKLGSPWDTTRDTQKTGKPCLFSTSLVIASTSIFASALQMIWGHAWARPSTGFPLAPLACARLGHWLSVWSQQRSTSLTWPGYFTSGLKFVSSRPLVKYPG